jgi:hypothetical protein
MALKLCNLFYSPLSTNVQTFDSTHEYPATYASNARSSNVDIVAGALKVGSYGLTVPTSGDYMTYPVTSQDVINYEEGSIGFWLRYVSALPTAGAGIINIDDAGQNIINLRTNATNNDELTMRIRQTGQVAVDISTTDANLTFNTWYFIVLRWSATTDLGRIEVYNDTLGTARATAEAAVTLFPTALTRMQVGEYTVTATAFYLDHLMIGDSWAEADTMLLNTGITSYTEYGAAPAATTRYNSFAELMADGTIDMDNDTFNVCLATSSYTPSLTHTQLSDVSANRVSGTTDVALTGVTWAQTSGTAKFDATDTDSVFSTTQTVKYAVIYSDTSTNDNLVAYVTLPDATSITAGDTLRLVWDAAGIFTLA